MKKSRNFLIAIVIYGSITISLVTFSYLNIFHGGWFFKIYNYDKYEFLFVFLLFISLVVFFTTILYKNLVLNKNALD